jgi:HEAT repeat protein
MRRSEDPEPPDVDQLVRDLAMRQQWEADFLRSLRLLRTRLYPEAVPGLVAMLTEGNANRFYAIELLGSIGDRAAIQVLRAAGDRDRDPTTRTYAQKVLGELGSH